MTDLNIRIRPYLMKQSPHTLAALAMQQIKARELAPTPENFARLYYEASVRPMHELVPDARLVNGLYDKHEEMNRNAATLRLIKTPDDTMRQVVTLLAHASGLMEMIEAGRKELQQSQQALRQMEEKLAETTRELGIDALTNTLNRRGLANCLSREIARAKRHRDKLSAIMVDLDHFKQINDAHGHEAGDQMIVHFAQLIRFVIRDADYVARFGGEEFVLILPEADSIHAEMVALRLQTMLSKSPLIYGEHEINVTFSAGIAEYRGNEEGAELLRRADSALYAAKAAGRNCFKLAS